MTSRSRLVLTFCVIAAIVSTGCGGNSTASAGQSGRRGAVGGTGQVGHVRAAQAVLSRQPALEVERLDPRSRVVESLIQLADRAGRNDQRAFDRAISDARRAIQRYRRSIGGDVAAQKEVETFALMVDDVIALATYTATETGADPDAETEAEIHAGDGVDIAALTRGATDAITAAAKTSLPVENPQR
jgi:hypothetical protein